MNFILGDLAELLNKTEAELNYLFNESVYMDNEDIARLNKLVTTIELIIKHSPKS